MLLNRQSKDAFFHLNELFSSELPGEIGNGEIASFHLNAACCFYTKHMKHILNHLVTAEPPFSVKTIDCMQYIALLPSRLMFIKSVTVSLAVSTSSSAIAERPRDARVTLIRKIAKWNF